MVNESKFEIPAWLSGLLTSEGLKRLESVVKDAEQQTTGEIVPVVVRRSLDLSPPTRMVTLMVLFIYLLVAEMWMTSFDDLMLDLWFVVGLFVAVAVSRMMGRTAFTRWLLTRPRDMRHMAEVRAEIEFSRLGVGKTKGQTGILLFLAVEDRRAVILGDAAISSKISAEQWNDVMSLMIAGLRDKNLEKGLTDAITACGRVLATHFPMQGQTNPNELSNRIVIKA
jgi:putative membrane protein